MSWISDGMTAQATLLSCATSTFVSYFMPIDLNGVGKRTRALCFLPDLSLISLSRTSCAYLAIELFPLDTYHRLAEKVRGSMMS